MVTTSTVISASEYNNLRTKIMNVMGVGSGDSGYGQALNIPVMDNTRPILASDLVPMRAALLAARKHQLGSNIGFTDAQLPIIPKGNVVYATEFSKYEAAANVIISNRLNYSNISMTVYNNVHTVTRPSHWGPRQTISSVVNVLWVNNDRVRWFFNSGGDIRLSFNQPVGGFFGTRAWSTALAKIGTIRFSGHNTTRSGTAGTPANIGYHHIGTDWSQIFNGENIDTPYPYGVRHSNYGFLDDVYVNVRRIENGLAFQIMLVEDNHDQIIDPGTSFTFSFQKATTYLNNPVGQSPQFYTQTNL